MKITENPLANTATQPQVGVILESSTPVFTCQENQFTKIGNDPDITTIGIMALHIGEGNTVIRKNTFSGISIGNLSNGINGFWPSTGLLYECNENYDVTWRDFSVLAGYIKSLQGHSINPNEFISAGNRFSQIATDYSCFIQQPDTNVTRKVRYHFYIYDQNQDPQVLEGNIVKFASEHDNPCESTICDPRCLDETELEQAKIEYYLNKTVYESLYVEYAASPTEQEELALDYYRLRMDESAQMVILHELYDTLSFDLDTLHAWIKNLNTLESYTQRKVVCEKVEAIGLLSA